MNSPLDPDSDAEATTNGGFFSYDAGRQVLPREELHSRLSALMRSCEGCENVVVTGTTRLDRPDSDGCNWSASIVLDPGGAAPQVYALAYAWVITMARASWNLE